MSSLFPNGNKIVILYILVSLIILAILIPKLNSAYGSFNPQNSNLSVWSNEYNLTYNDHKYTVTDQLTEDIDRVIGEVAYHGNNPGIFRLFSIDLVDDYSKIAVETQIGYLVAILEK